MISQLCHERISKSDWKNTRVANLLSMDGAGHSEDVS